MRRRPSSHRSSNTTSIRTEATATATTTMEMDMIRAMVDTTMTRATEEEVLLLQTKVTRRRNTTILGQMDLRVEGDRCLEEEGVR